jgi:hypothetical protein
LRLRFEIEVEIEIEIDVGRCLSGELRGIAVGMTVVLELGRNWSCGMTDEWGKRWGRIGWIEGFAASEGKGV